MGWICMDEPKWKPGSLGHGYFYPQKRGIWGLFLVDEFSAHHLPSPVLTPFIPDWEMIARREVYVGMKRRKAGSTWTWSGVMARIMRKSYTLRKRSQARPVRRLEKPQAASRLPWTSKSDRLPEKASNSCSTLKLRRSRRETWKREKLLPATSVTGRRLRHLINSANILPKRTKVRDTDRVKRGEPRNRRDAPKNSFTFCLQGTSCRKCQDPRKSQAQSNTLSRKRCHPSHPSSWIQLGKADPSI